MKGFCAAFFLLYALLQRSYVCDSAPVEVIDVAQFVQNHSTASPQAVPVVEYATIYSKLPKYIIDSILLGGLPYGKQRTIAYVSFPVKLISVLYLNRVSQMRLIICYM